MTNAQASFERLHPALQYHVVNSLGWPSLRALQEQAIPPLLDGRHALIVAPTAGGKTEAAVLPLLSRMLTESWQGASLVYVCPIKALLNNLEQRLSRYAGLVGRRVELWHGDVGQGARRRIRKDPPDVLLTTPESLEVMLVSRLSDRAVLFGGARAVVVDELHAFAGDDRGWHLLSVLARIERLAAQPLQRVGLSATIGNPAELLAWLCGSGEATGCVIAPEAGTPAPADVELDYVGSLENAAKVIGQLHRGDKRLVFLDSRARVERLAVELREAGVTTFVSHSSLGVDERRRAEEAFAEGRDCVIVATSTLELGIDVGDLDRVIQIDAPTTVSSFLQRLGRTGRRPGTRRNCLFLATSEDALLLAAGVIRLWSKGFVEPVVPPSEPFHILAQQIMALALQEGGVGRAAWPRWIGGVPAFEAMSAADVSAVLDHMLEAGILFEDAGILSMGLEGERAFGFRHFMELYSVFTSPPLFTVLHGREELGHVHEASFQTRDGQTPVLLLGARSWRVSHLDWSRRVAYVEPTADEGRSRWIGGGGALHFALARAVRGVLSDGRCPARLSSRATERLARLMEEYPWVDEDGSAVVRDAGGHLRWWTFAGLRANAMLAAAVAPLVDPGMRLDNFFIPLTASAAAASLSSLLEQIDVGSLVNHLPLPSGAMDGLKFSTCLPRRLAERTLRHRLADVAGARAASSESIRSVQLGRG